MQDVYTVYYLSLSTQSVTLSWLRVAVLCVTKGLCISPVLSLRQNNVLRLILKFCVSLMFPGTVEPYVCTAQKNFFLVYTVRAGAAPEDCARVMASASSSSDASILTWSSLCPRRQERVSRR